MALSLISLSATALGTRLLVLSVVWLPAVCAHVPDTHRCVPPHSQNYAFVIDCQAWKQKLALWGYLMLANQLFSMRLPRRACPWRIILFALLTPLSGS